MRKNILTILPLRIQEVMRQLNSQVILKLEEIRIRIGRPIELVVGNMSYFLTAAGELSKESEQGMTALAEDGQKLLNVISRHSVYAIEEELRRGYITFQGGHRIGIAGKAVVEQGRVKFIKDIKSFNIRIAREYIGISFSIMDYILRDRQFLSTLLISPPRCGKTTLLRDMIRQLSYGSPVHRLEGLKIGLVDERSEVASCLDGVPQYDIGPRVDVLDSCPKAEGMSMLIRSMSPDIIATDEIGSAEDTQAILEALHAGVGVLTTAHGSSIKDIQKRPSLQALLKHQVFQRYIILSKRNGVGTIEEILDQQFRKLKLPIEGYLHA